MNKQAYDAAMYSAFFDELEKLGYPVDDMMKEAVLKEVGQGMASFGKFLGRKAQSGASAVKSAVTPSSVTMRRAMAKPGATSVGKSPAQLIEAGKAPQLNPALRSPGPTVKMRPMAQRAAPPQRAVGGSSMVWGT